MTKEETQYSEIIVEQLKYQKERLCERIKNENDLFLETALFNDIKRLDNEIAKMESKILDEKIFKNNISTREGLENFVLHLIKKYNEKINNNN
jgi:hypothetical protein